MRGQIIRRGRKSWAIQVYLGRDPLTGRERRKWYTHHSRRDAERHLHQLVAHLEAGGAVPTTKKTVGEYLEEWLREKAPHVAPTTLASYRETVRVYLTPYFGHIPLTKLSPTAVRDYITEKLAADLSGTTVRYHCAILKMALAQAHRDGLVVRNVAALVKAPPKSRREMQTLDLEQTRLFLGEARRTSPYYRFYLAAVMTGARLGELCGLRWKDCDLTLGRAAIQQTFYRLGGSKREGIQTQQLFKAPKTAAARRSIPLPPELVSELLALREEQREQKRRRGDRYHDLDLVFCQPNGKPLHGGNVRRRDFQEILKRAKLPRLRLHDLRHTAATLHLARGTHPKVVADLLGHANVGLTLAVYSHALQALQEDATRQLATMLVASQEASLLTTGDAQPGAGLTV